MIGLLLALLVGCPADPPDDPPPVALVADAGPDVDGVLGEPLTLDGSASEGAAAWAWDFGDGLLGEGAVVEHRYSAPGHHVAVLTVADADGRTATDAAVVTVREPAAAAPIRNASPLVGDGTTLWVAMPDFDLVAVVDRAAGAVTGHLPVCATPRSLALFEGTLAVACAGDDTVELWDAAAGTLREALPFPPGSAPWAALPGPAGSIDVLLRSRGQLARQPSEDGPMALGDAVADGVGAAALGNRVLLTRFRSDDDAGEVWDSEGAPIALPRDPGPDSDTGARGVPTYLGQIAIAPSGRRAAVVGLQANVERGLYREGRALTHETTARATLRLIDLDSGEQVAARSFDDRDLGSAVAWSPRGDWLYVATHGMETVEILDPWTLQLAGAFLSVGHGPTGLWADDASVWVACELSRELVGFDVTDLGAPPRVLARIDLLPATGEVLDPDVLRGKQIFHRSADPRMTKDGYISCGSCHLDGDGDNRTWDFTDRGEGLRNTPSLRGRAGAAPIHWTGNFDEVQDFENDVRGPFQGSGFLSDSDWISTSDTLGAPKAGLSDELDALAAYVESLAAPLPSPFAGEDVSAGFALFTDPVVGCVDCHPPPAYTDSQFLAPGVPLLHDVGTLSEASGQRMGQELLGLDTPQLFGLWGSAPYLHDGSAATLRDVLVARNALDEHGVTSHLEEEDLEALEGFLRSL